MRLTTVDKFNSQLQVWLWHLCRPKCVKIGRVPEKNKSQESDITGWAVGQHCYNGDVRFLWEKLELWPPVKFKPLNRLSQNLSQLIKSTRGTFVPSLVKIRSWELLGKCHVLVTFILTFDRYLPPPPPPPHPQKRV